MRMLNKFILLGMLAVLFGCKDDNLKQHNTIGIYLMKSFELVPGKCLVDKQTFVLKDTPLVENDDILQYSVSAHEYTVSKNSQEKIRGLTPRTPFAVTVNNELIFTGIYMAAYISSSCDHSIVMMLGEPQGTIRLNLGYPGIGVNTAIEDQRNNPKLLSALAHQGKLY